MNKKVKTILATLSIFLLIFSLSGCGKKEEIDPIEDRFNNLETEKVEEVVDDAKSPAKFNEMLALKGKFIEKIIINNDDVIVNLFKDNVIVFDDYANSNGYIVSYEDFNAKAYKKEEVDKILNFSYAISEMAVSSSFQIEFFSNDNAVDLINNKFIELKELFGIDLTNDCEKIIEIYKDNENLKEYFNKYQLSHLNYDVSYNKYVDAKGNLKNNIIVNYMYLPDEKFVDNQNDVKNSIKDINVNEDEFSELQKNIKKSLTDFVPSDIKSHYYGYLENYKKFAKYYNLNSVTSEDVENNIIYTFSKNKSDIYNETLSFRIMPNSIYSELIYNLDNLSEEKLNTFIEQANKIYGLDLSSYRDEILNNKDKKDDVYIENEIKSDYQESIFMFNKYEMNGKINFDLILYVGRG